MPVFNSLGSNYDFLFVVLGLLLDNDERYKEQLKEVLEKRYHGEVTFTYKGREALRLALKASNQKGATIAICGFTCYAVYDAVIKEGYTVEYLDIEKDALHFSFQTLKEHVQKNPNIKIVIIQNTLGYPCDIEKIASFCKEKNLILIEDLAHAIGSRYKQGQEAGTIGDFVILSFSQDKVVDGISGGALIVNNKNFKVSSKEDEFKEIPRKKQYIDKVYPLLTFLIRNTYTVGIGKVLHKFCKTFHLLANPMTDSKKIQTLPGWYGYLIYKEFLSIGNNLLHRKKIATIYSEMLDKKMLLKNMDKQISLSTNIRFPLLVEKRESLIAFLKKNNIHVSDIWYDSPIAPKKYLHLTDYKNQCPNAEIVSSQIINLPTHKHVSETQAKHIAQKINQWLKSQ